MKFRIAAEVRDVVHAAGDEIVDADDLVAAGEQQVGEVRAEKAGGAGDDGGGLACVSWLGFASVGWVSDGSGVA